MYEGDRLMAKVVDKMDEFKKRFNEDLFYDNEALLRKANYDEGKAAGIKESIELSKKEEKVEIAENLLKMNMNANDIVKVLSLPLKEIEKIKNMLVKMLLGEF